MSPKEYALKSRDLLKKDVLNIDVKLVNIMKVENDLITFMEEDVIKDHFSHNYSNVSKIMIENYNIFWILVNKGSAIDVLQPWHIS